MPIRARVKSVDVMRSDRTGMVIEPFLFNGHAVGKSTVESDLFLEALNFL